MQSHNLDLQFGALADPTRRAIIRQVWSQDASAGEIAAKFDISRPAISRHLRVLRDSRLVQVRQEGTSRLYRADIDAFDRLRRQFESFWDHGLARLKQIAEAEHARSEVGNG